MDKLENDDIEDEIYEGVTETENKPLNLELLSKFPAKELREMQQYFFSDNGIVDNHQLIMM